MARIGTTLDSGEDAVARLVHDHHARIYAFLRRLSGSDSNATELTQRTFCRAWTSMESFAGRSSVSSWLHSIAYRTYVDWVRSDRRTESRPDSWWGGIPDGAVGPDRAAVDADSARAVYAAVEGLEPAARETVHLHYYQGLSIEETAQVLGLATSTVKYRMREALAVIQRRVARAEDPARTAPPPNHSPSSFPSNPTANPRP